MKRAIIVSLFLIAPLFIAGCQNNSDGGDPIVTITMANNEEIILELYPDVAPNTVNNFISLIQDEFYNGLIFHRVIPEFMIQGGMGDAEHMIDGEFSSNDFENDLEHERGILSMARTSDPDSAGSQFFIVVEDSPHLDGEYASFGMVTDGMDVVDEIVSVEVDEMDKPLEDQQMKKIRIDLNGHKFQEPEIE